MKKKIAIFGMILIFTLGNFVMAEVWQKIETGDPRPDERNGHVLISGGSEKFVFGGFDQDSDLWVLRQEGDTWRWENTGTREPDTPSERGGHSGIFVSGGAGDDYIIIFGGSESPLVAPSDIVTYKLANPWDWNSKWEKLFPIVFPPPMAEHTAVYDSNNKWMIVFGGYTGYPIVASNDTYALDFSFTPAFWTLVNIPGDKPDPRYGHSAVWADWRMMVFGGKDEDGNLLNDCWYLDWVNWEETPLIGNDKPPARWQHTAIWIMGDYMAMEPGGMLIFGGEGENGPLNDVWFLQEPEFGPGEPYWKWEEIYPIGDLPSRRSGHAAALGWGGEGQQMFIFGGRSDGNNNFNDVYAFRRAEQVEQTLQEKPFNAPNPFNPDTRDTKICYYLDEDDDDVKIKLFTLTGELVYSWENIFGRKGLNQESWDGRNEKGRIVENGGYICLIEAGGEKQKCKIAVLR